MVYIGGERATRLLGILERVSNAARALEVEVDLGRPEVNEKTQIVREAIAGAKTELEAAVLTPQVDVDVALEIEEKAPTIRDAMRQMETQLARAEALFTTTEGHLDQYRAHRDCLIRLLTSLGVDEARLGRASRLTIFQVRRIVEDDLQWARAPFPATTFPRRTRGRSMTCGALPACSPP